MNDSTRTNEPRDDLDAYMATLSEEERQNIARAGEALDLALLLHEIREARGVTQTEAASLAGVRQQAISRWERSHPNMRLETLRRYLDALGYSLGIVVTDQETGEVVANVGLPA